MVFQHNLSRTQIALDITNKPLIPIPTSTNPSDTLKRNIIKPDKDFSTFKTGPTPIVSTRSVNMFQMSMMENINSGSKNCSSCGGAK